MLTFDLRRSLRILGERAWHALRDERGVFDMTTRGPSTVFKPQMPVGSGVIPPVQISDVAFTTTSGSGLGKHVASQRAVWLAEFGVAPKGATGFVVDFGTPAPAAGGTLDWEV